MAQICREFSSEMRRKDGEDTAIPTMVGNSPLLGFGVDTSAAAITIANYPKG
jgi:hypothetical protein